MASIKEIRTHIKSVEQTLKITNAMFLISSSNLQKDDLRSRKHKIHYIKQKRIFPCLRDHLILLRSRNFRTHQKHRIFIIQRRQHQGKHEHTHAPDPMGKVPPEQHAIR